MAQAGKTAYSGVGNLLQVDDRGYYYYDSSYNFASFDEDSNKFTLYNNGAVDGGGGTASQNSGTQFFPFNTANQVFDSGKLNSDNTLHANSNVKSSQNGTLNHYFGLTMSTKFTTQKQGKVTGLDGVERDMEYNFSGDDDVWIYIDDVLVADLGGIHDPVGVSINFAKGTITYGNMNEDGSLSEYKNATTTIYDAFLAAGKADDTEWQDSGDGSTKIFEDDGYHTIKMFYMERGNQASNLRLSFNLVNIPESSIVKVDQSGNPVAEVAFELYGTDENYVFTRGKSLVAEGKTDGDGHLVMLDPLTELPISFDEIYERGKDQNGGYLHYVLHEVHAPDGYRTSGNVELDYHPAESNGSQEFGGYVTSNTDNMWETGAYANSGVLVTAPDHVYPLSDTSQPNSKGEEIDTKQGTMFAVVLMYQGETPESYEDLANQANWKVVTGSALEGYQYHNANSIDEVAAAVAGDLDAAYPFTLQVKGGFQAVIDDLPGNIETYYNLLESKYGVPTGENIDKYENLKYTVAYYHTNGTLRQANGENTQRLYIEGTGAEAWHRQFSVSLKVPNIKNRLFVQKTDEDWHPLTDIDKKLTAEFSLYTPDQINFKDDCEPKVDNYWTDCEPVSVKKDAIPYDTATTQPELSVSDAGTDKNKMLMRSAAVFPTNGHVLKTGTYYLKETKQPSYGYKATQTITKVIVTNDGVYADAGTSSVGTDEQPGDDIRVWKGVGTLVRTMAEFAADDKFDNTLRDITATLQRGSNPTYSQQNGWIYDWQNLRPRLLNLTYGSGGAVLHYGLTDTEASSPTASFEDVSLMNDVGWSNLKITQNYDRGVSNNLKQPLDPDRDLSALFSGTTTVQVRNNPDSQNVSLPLNVKKTVNGGSWPENGIFTFKLTAEPYADKRITTPLPVGKDVVCESEAGEDGSRSCTITVADPNDGTNQNEVLFGHLTFTTQLFKDLGWPTKDVPSIPDDPDSPIVKVNAPLIFTYTISEIKPDKGAVEGMTYSKAVYTLTVTVNRKASNPINALSAIAVLKRVSNDDGTSSDVQDISAWGDDTEESDHITPVAEFTNWFGYPFLPATGGLGSRMIVLAGITVLAVASMGVASTWRRNRRVRRH